MKHPEQRLGSTRSGLIIQDQLTNEVDELNNVTQNYCCADHFDAYALFQFLVTRELSKYGRQSMCRQSTSTLANTPMSFDFVTRFCDYQMLGLLLR